MAAAPVSYSLWHVTPEVGSVGFWGGAEETTLLMDYCQLQAKIHRVRFKQFHAHPLWTQSTGYPPSSVELKDYAGSQSSNKAGSTEIKICTE